MINVLTKEEINKEKITKFIVSFNNYPYNNELFKVLHVNDDEMAFWCERIELSLLGDNIVVYDYNNNIIGMIKIEKIKDIWYC